MLSSPVSIVEIAEQLERIEDSEEVTADAEAGVGQPAKTKQSWPI